MNPAVTPITGSTPAPLQGAYGSQTDLESISSNNNKTDAQKVGELTKEFEAMLFKQIIKPDSTLQKETVKWVSFETAIQKAKNDGKKILVHLINENSISSNIMASPSLGIRRSSTT